MPSTRSVVVAIWALLGAVETSWAGFMVASSVLRQDLEGIVVCLCYRRARGTWLKKTLMHPGVGVAAEMRDHAAPQ